MPSSTSDESNLSLPVRGRQLAAIVFGVLLTVAVIGPGVIMLPGVDSDHAGTAAAQSTSDSDSVFTGADSGVTKGIDSGDQSEQWSTDLGSVTSMQDSAISPDSSTVYYATYSPHQVVAVDASSGSQDWTYTSGSGARAVTTSWDGATVYFATDDFLVALDAADGTEKWNKSVSNQAANGAMEVDPDENIYIGDTSGNVTVYDGADGSSQQEVVVDSGFSVEAVEVDPDTNDFYATTSGEKTARYDETGTEQWSKDWGSGTNYDLAFDGDNNEVYVSNENTGVRVRVVSAVDGSTARNLSTTHSNTINQLSLSSDATSVYTASSDNDVKSFDASDGTEQWAFTGHTTTVQSVVSTGDKQWGGDVTGQFTDQYGEPVSNATIYTTDYNQSETISIGSRTLDGIMNDPKPQEWHQQINDLESFDKSQFNPDFGASDILNEKRVLLHSEADWEADTVPDKYLVSDLVYEGTPPENVPARPAVDDDQQALFACWSPTDDAFSDPIDSSIPGAETTSCEITIKRVDPLGNHIDARTIETQPLHDVAHWTNTGEDGISLGGPVKTHEAAAVDLDSGVYYVHPKGSPEDGLYYTIAEGANPDTIEPDVQNWESACSNGETDQPWHDKVCEKTNEFTTPRTTTNETGHYTLNVNEDRIERLWITGVKNGNTTNADETLTLAAVRNEYETTVRNNYRREAPSGWDPDAYSREEFRDYCQDMPSIGEEVGLPVTGTTTTQVPNDAADIQGVRAAPPELPPAIHECAAVNLVEDFLNDNLGFLDSGFLDDLRNLDPRAKLAKLLPLLTADPELKKAVEDATGITLDSDDPADYSEREARQILREGGQKLDDGTTGGIGGGGGGGGGPVVDNGEATVDETAATISQVWGVDGVDNWDDAALLIRLDWSNGTTTTLNRSSEYVTVEENPIGSDEVRLTDYPVGEQDPATVTPRLDVSTPDGTDGGTNPGIRNPTFDGTIPGIDYVRLSSMQPGPSETVTLDVQGDDGLQGLERVELTRPDGTTETIQPDADGEAAWTTSGEGTYRVATVVSNPSGTEFTEVLRVKAGQQTSTQPPTVRAATGATGRYAVASDGMQGAELTVSQGASRVEIAGILNTDTPSQVLVDTSGASIAPTVEHDVELRYGPDQQRVEDTVPMILRQPATSDNALYYREGRPVPEDEQGTEGTIRRYDNATVYDTYTAGDGTLTTVTIDDPGWVQRIWYSIRVRSPVDPGALGDGPSVGSTQTNVGVVA